MADAARIHNASPSNMSKEDGSDDTICITLTYKSKAHSFALPSSGSLSDLSAQISTVLSIPPENQKLMAPKLGLLKPPFGPSSPPLSALQGKKITLMGSTAAVTSSITHAAAVAARRASARSTALLHPPSSRTPRNNFSSGRQADDAKYTFQRIEPLPMLRDPPASLAYLQRLAADPGIRQTMRTHQFTVGLLTEMDPAQHTQVSHDGVGRTLGLNQNAGQVIYLRLRTDDDLGYRDYKTVRRTLCHELAHNVHGPHDAKFWKLCREIEREVEGVEKGARTMGDPEDLGPLGPVGAEEEEYDAGGWTGGDFVLGGGGAGSGAQEGSRTRLSRREMMAKAAEERAKRARENEEGGQSGP